MRKIVVVLASVLVFVLATSVPVAAASTDQSTNDGTVTEYYSLYYNTQLCHGDYKYKITMDAARWYRTTTDRKIGSAYHRLGESGADCNDHWQTASYNFTYYPCFKCRSVTDWHWTPTYSFGVSGWPYVGEPVVPQTAVGGAVVGYITTGGGTHVQPYPLCARINLAGTVSCAGG